MNEMPPAVPRRVKRFAWFAAGLMIAAAVALVGFTVSDRADADAAPEAPAGTPATAVTLAPERLAHVLVEPVAAIDVPMRTSVPGRVAFNGNRVTPLFAQFSGRVARLDAEVGTVVREGNVLGMLDSPDVVALQAGYQEAMAAERAARASLEQADRARDRAARLAEVEAIPLRELQEAEVTAAHAAQERRRAEAALAAARGRLEIAGFGTAEIERLDEGPATIARLIPLTAPVSGTVVERNVGLGQVVEPGSGALFEMADLSDVWILADVYEDQLTSIRIGAEVTIQTPAYPGEVFTARVDRIGPTVDPGTRTVAVRCVVRNGDGRLKPGMFATVALQAPDVDRALVVPASAIVASGARRAVFVETGPGTFEERIVEVGRELPETVVVDAGLAEGERVVVRGSLLLAAELLEARNGR